MTNFTQKSSMVFDATIRLLTRALFLLAIVSLLSLTCWRAEASEFNRRPVKTCNSIPVMQGAAAITYLKERKLYDSLRAALNVARNQRGDYSVVTPLFGNQQELTASDGGAMNLFGSSVAVSGSTVVVGAQFDTIGANIRQGSVYVFNRQGGSWVEAQKLTVQPSRNSTHWACTSWGPRRRHSHDPCGIVNKPPRSEIYKLLRRVGLDRGYQLPQSVVS